MKQIQTSILCLIALVALAAGVAFAADIDGTWTAQMEGRNGQARTETLMLKASGNTLTGTIQGGRGGPVQISNGTIDGDSISFSVVREFRGNQMTQQYKGAISGTDLKLTITGGRRGSMDVTFKKQ